MALETKFKKKYLIIIFLLISTFGLMVYLLVYTNIFPLLTSNKPNILVWNQADIINPPFQYPNGWHIWFTRSLSDEREENARLSIYYLNPGPINDSDYGGSHSLILIKETRNLKEPEKVFDSILKLKYDFNENVQTEIISTPLGELHHLFIESGNYGNGTETYIILIEDKDKPVNFGGFTNKRIIEATLNASNDKYYSSIFNKIVDSFFQN